MVPGISPGDLEGLAEDFLATIISALDSIPEYAPTAALKGAPERAFTSPGTPIADCCEQAAVYVQTVANRAQGEKGTSPRIPAPLLVAVVTRCVPQGTSKTVGKRLVYTPPTPESLSEASDQHNADGWAMWTHIYALIDAEQFLTRCTGVTFEGMVPITPAGGCAGWQLNVRANLGAYPVDPATLEASS